MGMCGNEDFTLPKQIIAVEMTFADECRSSTTMQGFALVPIANGVGHCSSSMKGVANAGLFAFDGGPASELAHFARDRQRPRREVHRCRSHRESHQPLVADIGQAVRSANVRALARKVSPSHLPAKSKASK